MKKCKNLLEDNKHIEGVKARVFTELLPLRQTKDICGANALFQLEYKDLE